MKVTTSEEGFRAACPCAKKIMRYVASLPELEGVTRHFAKAMIRPEHTTVVFVCTGLPGGSQELSVSASADGGDGWTFRHGPVFLGKPPRSVR